MAGQEQKFVDGFMLLVGVWIGAVAGIVIFGNFVGDEATVHEGEEESSMSLIDERIRPIGQVALVGDADVGALAAMTVQTETVRAPLTGPQVYNEICQLCHTAPGIGGAPVFGDTVAWAARLEQSAELLQDHVINGYTGEAGYMPPKGGRLDLSDEEIIEALDYMLEAVQ